MTSSEVTHSRVTMSHFWWRHNLLTWHWADWTKNLEKGKRDLMMPWIIFEWEESDDDVITTISGFITMTRNLRVMKWLRNDNKLSVGSIKSFAKWRHLGFAPKDRWFKEWRHWNDITITSFWWRHHSVTVMTASQLHGALSIIGL